MAQLKLFFLGSPRLEVDGARMACDSKKSLALLAYLAVTGQTHSRDALSTLLWPDRAVGTNILHNLERKAEIVENQLKGNKLLFGLCSRSGFTAQLEQDVVDRDDVFLFGLSQIIGDTD